MNSDQKVIKPIIAKILDIPVTNDWDIYDKVVEEGLYLVHYNQNANMNEFGHVRGIIIDINDEKVVCSSYGYTPGVIVDELVTSDSNDNTSDDNSDDSNNELDNKNDQVVQDTNGNNFILNFDELEFFIGHEGVIIRIFLFNKKVYYSSHRKIEIRNKRSRWGTSIPFHQMLTDLNMVGERTFYPEESDLDSRRIHLIMISHPSVLHATKDIVGNGYLSYLGSIEMQSSDSSSTPSLEVNDNNDKFFNSDIFTDDLDIAKKNQHLYRPKKISIEEVNDHLKYGFYKDYVQGLKNGIEDDRLGFGEYVVAFKKKREVGSPMECIRIQSSAYTWRLKLRDNGLNPLRQFFILLNSSHIDTTKSSNMVEFKNKFPLLDKYDVASIQQLLNDGRIIKSWTQNKVSDSYILTQENRIYNIWACYLLASPFHLQREIAKMYDFYVDNKNKLVDYIYNIYIEKKYSDLKDRNGNHLQGIITSSINRTKRKLNNKWIKKDKYNEVIKNSIRISLEMKEESIVYRMVKYMIEHRISDA